MTTNNIWLEVRKDNGAILSFFLEKPAAPSAIVDYIHATQDELVYLNSLEEFIFPAGMVATLDDLAAHRERLQAAKKKSAALPTETNSKTAGDKQQPTKKLTKSEFMAGFKKVNLPRKQGNQ